MVSQAFLRFKDAQDAIRAYLDTFPGKVIPNALRRELEEAQKLYEAERKAKGEID